MNFDISELENILFGQPVSTRLSRACHNPKTDNATKIFRKVGNIKQNSNLSTELRLDHEPQEKPQESCSRKPQKKIGIAAAATRGLRYTHINLYIYKKMSRQISCEFKNLDKLGVRINKIKNTLLVGFF